MKWQNTAILAVLALGIGSYVYFVESKSELPVDDKLTFVWNLTDNQAQGIDKVTLTAGTGSVVLVKVPAEPTPKPAKGQSPSPSASPAGPSWRVEGKKDVPLTYEWDTSWNDLKRLQADRVVEEDGKDDSLYEFASPSLKVTMAEGKKADAYQLEVGKKSITGSGYYARVTGTRKVYLLTGYKVENWLKLIGHPPFATPTPAPTPAATASLTASGSAAQANP